MWCSFHTHLVVSTPRETHMFRMSSDSATRLDVGTAIGLSHKTPTIVMSNLAKRVPKSVGKSVTTYVNSSFAAQVTSHEVLLLNIHPSLTFPVLIGDPWTPNKVDGWEGKEISAASINASQVALALSGGILVVLNVDEEDQLRLHS